MTFNDIFKSSFLETVQSVQWVDIALAFVFSLAIGLFIMWVYKRTFKGVMYSKSFATSLLAIDLITTMIILTISSNIILSLGMVGALSIVRFRTAIKEPMDIAFMFWAIGVGIVFGAGLIPLGLVSSLIIGLIILLFANRKSEAESYILVVNCDERAEGAVVSEIRKSVKDYLLKAKTVSEDGTELTLQLRLKHGTDGFVGSVKGLPGVKSAVLVSYNGDYLD